MHLHLSHNGFKAWRVAIGVVPTMVTIMMIWLIGKISSRRRVQALAKVIAWILLICTTWANLIGYFAGVMIAFEIPREIASNIMLPGWLGFFILCPAVFYYAIIPKYRNNYPDVSFLKGKFQLFFLITVSCTLAFFLIMATH